MPIILCPQCSKITYAYPLYDEDVITSYRCSGCWNVYNIDQANTIPFPNEEIILATTFADIVSEVDNIDKDELLEKYTSKQIAEKFLYCMLYLARPHNIRLFNRYGKIVWFFAPWDYRGTEEAEEHNDELLEEAQRVFAEAVDRNYVIIEIREMDEGNSIFIAIHPDDVAKLKSFLKEYIKEYILA